MQKNKTYIKVNNPGLYSFELISPATSFEIYEDTGKLYFQRDLKNRKNLRLNINHPGNYYAYNVNYFNVSPRKVFKCFIEKLPEPEKNIEKKPMYIAFNKDLQSTPARIDVKTGRIEVGPFFESLPRPIQDFILLHEVGHNYYYTETYCDQYALRQYINNFGNPSQAFYALAKVFKNPQYQAERILNVYNNIEKL